MVSTLAAMLSRMTRIAPAQETSWMEKKGRRQAGVDMEGGWQHQKAL